MMDLLTIKGLRKEYEHKEGLKHLDFTLRPGEVLGLVGPNGAGKSTSIKAMLGLIQPDQGEVVVRESMSVADPDAKRLIGYIPEFPVLYSDLSLKEHVRFLGMAYGIKEEELKKRYDRLVQQFDMEGKADDPAIHLSKGMEQKLATICALIFQPQILIADEPFNGLDPKGQREFKDILQEIAKEGGGVLHCTHQLDTAEKICDRFLILNQGQQIALGSLDSLRQASSLNSGSLEEVFLKLTREREE